MSEFINYYEPIQIFMDRVKKDILSKTNNLYNLKHSRELLNPLFNLLDYQITLINQIILFIQSNMKQNDDINNNNYNYLKSHTDHNNYKNNSKQKNMNHLIDINKDILGSMIIKFLTKINYMIVRNYKINNSKYNKKYKYNIKSDSMPLFNDSNYGKGNELYSNNSKKYINKNSLLPYDEKFSNINYIKKKNEGKNNKNSLKKKLIHSSSMENNLPNINYNINSDKSFKNKSKHNNFNFISPVYKRKDTTSKNRIVKDYLDCNNLIDEIKDDIENEIKNNDKSRQKTIPNKSYSNSTKDIFIDLNDDALKKLFNKPIYYNNSVTLNTKASKEE